MTIQFDYSIMKNICLAPVAQFSNIKGAQVKETAHGPLIYIDRGSKILGVAHLDSTTTADGLDHFYHLKVGKDEVVFNAQLDDRLGAYIILDLLPKLGITTDVLLTYGEETGNSTGQFFEPKKKYRWMYQFDRHGDDVVYYDYGEKDWNHLLGKYFKRPGHGMFSDICYMEHVGCKAFNLACGYENNHSAWAKADMHVLRDQVERFMKFYQAHRRQYFPHEKKKYTPKVKNNTYYYPRHYTGMGPNYMEEGWDDDWERKHPKRHGIVQGKICKLCHLPKVFADSEYSDICDACAGVAVVRCIACKVGYTGVKEHDYFMGHFVCPNCRASTQLTKIPCPQCHMVLYAYEVVQGICTSCKNFPELNSSRRI